MATQIEPGQAVLVRSQIIVDNQVAFASGERVVVEAIKPNPTRPQYKYVVYSKSLRKRFQLSDQDVTVEQGEKSESVKDAQMQGGAGKTAVYHGGTRVRAPILRKVKERKHFSNRQITVGIILATLIIAGGIFSLVWFLGREGAKNTKYANGTTGSEENNGLHSTVNDLVYNSSDSRLYAGCGNGHVYSYDGTGWTDTKGPGSSVYCLAFNGANSRIYAGCRYGYVYSYDGMSWRRTAGPGTRAGSVYCLLYDEANAALLAGCGKGHVFSYQGGSWSDVGIAGVTRAGDPTNPSTYAVLCLTYRPANNMFYAGCANGSVSMDTASYSGIWTYSGTVPSRYRVNDILCNTSDMQLYAACDYGHVYRFYEAGPSEERGSRWLDMGSPGNGPIHAIVYNPMDSRLYVGCEDGLVYANYEATWATAGTISGSPVVSLAYNPSDSRMYAGCKNGRVFSCGSNTTWTETKY